MIADQGLFVKACVVVVNTDAGRSSDVPEIRSAGVVAMC
jgi:hypothetical protein